MTKDSKKALFISIAVVAVFVIGTIATSYAFYSANVEKENTGNAGTSITTAKLDSTFTDGPNVNCSNILPGDTCTKIVLQEVENTFIAKNDIEIDVLENDISIFKGVYPSVTSAVSNTLTLNPNEEKSYKVVITYKNTTVDQSPDMGNYVKGKFFIEEI